MITPNIPHQSTPILNPDGTMHDDWHRFFSQMIKEMQNNLSEEGFTLPSQDSDSINALNIPKSIGRIIYDKTDGVAKINNNGVYKKILTEP